MYREWLRVASVVVGVLLAGHIAAAQGGGDPRDDEAGEDAPIEQWVEQLVEASPEDRGWRRMFGATQAAMDLGADQSFEVVKRAWPRIEPVEARRQIVKGWHFDLPMPFRVRLHPRTFDFFAMVLDADTDGAGEWVVGYLPTYAWREFATPGEARAWLDGVGDREPGDVIIRSVERWAEAWREGDAEARERLGDALFEVGHPFRRNPRLVEAAERSGAAALLVEIMEDPAAPHAARLGAMSQVRSLDPDRHDSDGWDEIYEEIREAARQRQEEQQERERQALLADVRLIDGDARKRWLLHGPGANEPPADGYGLLVVLPGGDGSIDFSGFVGNFIAREAGSDYLVAQMIAPPIEAGDEQAIVWPTERLPDDRVDFTMEPVIERAIADVRREHAVDPERIFIMGWSSGGPTSYGMLAREGSPVRGAFVVMSVFKPELLPALEGARGKSVYILHSPDDFIGMRFPEAARDEFSAAGARVRLETYEGGHGWQGDSTTHIRRAVEWLEGEG